MSTHRQSAKGVPHSGFHGGFIVGRSRPDADGRSFFPFFCYFFHELRLRRHCEPARASAARCLPGPVPAPGVGRAAAVLTLTMVLPRMLSRPTRARAVGPVSPGGSGVRGLENSGRAPSRVRPGPASSRDAPGGALRSRLSHRVGLLRRPPATPRDAVTVSRRSEAVPPASGHLRIGATPSKPPEIAAFSGKQPESDEIS
jgi:hypothetical protein